MDQLNVIHNLNTKVDEWYNTITDNNSIRILLYLQAYNPGIMVENLARDLKMEMNKITHGISKLEKFGAVTKQNNLCSLTKYGQIIVNTFEKLS